MRFGRVHLLAWAVGLLVAGAMAWVNWRDVDHNKVSVSGFGFQLWGSSTEWHGWPITGRETVFEDSEDEVTRREIEFWQNQDYPVAVAKWTNFGIGVTLAAGGVFICEWLLRRRFRVSLLTLLLASLALGALIYANATPTVNVNEITGAVWVQTGWPVTLAGASYHLQNDRAATGLRFFKQDHPWSSFPRRELAINAVCALTILVALMLALESMLDWKKRRAAAAARA